MAITSNIGGVLKRLETVHANVGGVVKNFSAVFANVNGTLKKIFLTRTTRGYFALVIPQARRPEAEPISAIIIPRLSEWIFPVQKRCPTDAEVTPQAEHFLLRQTVK